MPNKSCNQAAKIKNCSINVYEIQHGVIGAHHDYYRYKNSNESPTKFVVWTNHEKKVIQKLNPNLNPDFLINGLPTIYKKIKNKNKNSDTVKILFPTQPSIFEVFVPNLIVKH